MKQNTYLKGKKIIIKKKKNPTILITNFYSTYNKIVLHN